jgi:hypothetical protein
MNSMQMLFGLFLFFDLDYFTSLIEAAIRADSVWQAHAAAVTAGNQVAGLKRVMGATSVSASF